MLVQLKVKKVFLTFRSFKVSRYTVGIDTVESLLVSMGQGRIDTIGRIESLFKYPGAVESKENLWASKYTAGTGAVESMESIFDL